MTLSTAQIAAKPSKIVQFGALSGNMADPAVARSNKKHPAPRIPLADFRIGHRLKLAVVRIRNVHVFNFVVGVRLSGSELSVEARPTIISLPILALCSNK
jgi:hypothetical protein